MPIRLLKTNRFFGIILLCFTSYFSFGQKDDVFLIKKKLGDILFLKGDFSGAISNYRMAFAIDPSCAECNNKIKEAQSKIKNYYAGLKGKFKIIPSVESSKTPNSPVIIEPTKPIFPEMVEINYGFSFAKNFQIGKYEVSQKEWKIYCKLNELVFPEIPPNLKNDNFPIVNISWSDAKKYAEWLSVVSNQIYELPTKQEWNLAKDSISNIKEMAWIFENSQKILHEIGKKKPNKFGIHDIEGNIAEWVDDWYDKDFIEFKEISKFFEDNNNIKNRIVCGCSYKDELFVCKNGFSRSFDPEIKRDFVGFRMVKRNF